MSTQIVLIFFFAVIIRLLSLRKSIKNEKALKQTGAEEYGKDNTIMIMLSHTSFYLFCFIEAFIRKTQFDNITIAGIILYLFSTLILALVIKSLDRFWTFKLIIARDHKLNNNLIYRYLKHPNYYLNVIPELISIAMICKAWLTFLILFPIHLLLLRKRIIEENLIMREKFLEY